MATQFTYPGVYIQEFAPGAPIAGVGTSTPAFIGVATYGEYNVPTKITSFDQFISLYGDQPVQGFYLWYAVRGFFDNGGQVCYIVRASNGRYGSTDLNDGASKPLLTIRARKLGNLQPQPGISVGVSHLLLGASVYQPPSDTFTVTGPREVTLATPAKAAAYRPGDSISVGNFGDHVIARISGASGTVFGLADDLNAPLGPAAGNVKASDTQIGAKVFHIAPAAPLAPGALVPGTLLTIKQGAPSDTQAVAAVQTEYRATGTVTYRVTLRNGLAIPVNQATATTVQSEEFDLTISQGASSTTYNFLSVDAAHPRYYPNIVNADPTGLVYALPKEPAPATVVSKSLPSATITTLGPGTNEDLTSIPVSDYTAAIDTLVKVDDVNLVSAPDAITLDKLGAGTKAISVQQYVITHCEQMGDRFGVLDSEPGLPLFGNNSIGTQRQALDSQRGYAALYYPWLRVQPVGPGAPMLVPPSGHVCGIMARSDNTRGVHKAPANEIVGGAVGIELTMSDVDQGQLNIAGINVIRQFQGGGRPVLWGARTTATDTNWQYVNVRRLFLFLEESIQEGIRWAVFEPNNTALWAKLSRTITEFLTRVWRDGALFGNKPDEAFYVRIDETLNTDATRALGQLFIQIGVRPSYPAEFIIVKIGIWQGGSSLSEG